jgi:MFS family permease
MRAIQVLIILICFLCNMLDGMDVLIISYTAPAIAKAWSISPANLGIVFSSGLVGMTVGAIFSSAGGSFWAEATDDSGGRDHGKLHLFDVLRDGCERIDDLPLY